VSEEGVKWLREQVTQRLETAKVATATAPPPWRAADDESDSWIVTDATGEPLIYDEGTPSLGEARHIALNDPQDVIARCEAELAILDLHEGEYGPEHPCKDWLYPCKSTRLLASGYRHREGYAGHWGEVNRPA
jgi:hypothetical protein